MDKKLALTILFAGTDKLSGSLKKIVGLGKSGGQELGRMKREARELDRQLKDVRGRLSSAPLSPQLLKQERELAKAVTNTNRQLERQGKILVINNRVARMHARSDALMASGRSNVMGGAAMLALPALAVRSAVDYEKQITLIAQKTDMSAAASERFGKAMLSAARDARRMPDDVLGGADFLAGKGLNASELSAMMPGIARFGTAWDADVVDSSKAAYSAYSSLKVPLNQTSRALEIMAAAGKAGGFEVKDMAKEFPVLTGALASLGSTGLKAVADLSSALQVIEAQTGDGAEAATNLRNLMSFATSERGIKRFQKYGIDVTAALKKAAADGRSPIEELIKLTERATGGDDMKIGELFSNQQAAVAMQALTQRRAQYLEIRKQSLESSGLTEEEFARMSKTSASNWQALQSSLQTLSITLGTHLLPLVTRGADWISRATHAVGEWADRNPKLASTLLSVVVGLGAARVGLGALQFAFGGLLKPLASAWGVYQKWKTAETVAKAFPKAAKAFGILRTAALFMAKGVMKAGLIMLANPIVLVITLIVGALAVAGYMIYRHWDTIKGAFNAGMATLGRAWDWLKSTFQRFPYLFGPLGVAVAFITDNWDAISGAFNAGIARVKGFFSGLPDWMKNIGIAMMTGLVTALNPALLIAKLISVAKSGITAFKNYFGIKSPSRLFMQMGGFMTEGLARGVERGERRPIAAIGRMASGAAGIAGAAALGASQAATAAAPPAQISITIQQLPGEDSATLAKRVADELQRRMASQQRGAYRDG